MPTVDQWSTVAVSGGAGDVTDAAGMDPAVAAIPATSITTPLGSGTGTPAATSLGQWSSGGFVQTRPTGVKMTVLMATLRNDTGADRSSIIVNYNLTVANALTEVVKGHMVYFSLDGSTWTQIPALSDGPTDNTAGTYSKSATLSLGNWASGSLLYLLFADDNGSSSPDTALQIDNFGVQLSATPVAITTQPVSSTNAEYSLITLTVGESGTGPFVYQWYKNGSALAGATGAALVLTNTAGSGKNWGVPSDTGNYVVTVSGQAPGTATSTVARVVFLADTNAPRFLWALGTNTTAGGSEIHVRLSEAVTAIELEPLIWSVVRTAGPGSDLQSPDTVVVTNQDIYLTYDTVPIDPGTSYSVHYDGFAVTDLAASPNTMTQTTVPLLAHQTELVSFNHVWKYDEGVSQASPTNWYLPNFDDSDTAVWKSGPGPLDAKKAAAGTAGFNCRDTTTFYGLGTIGTCIALTNTVTGVENPMVFFRTHFTISSLPPNLMLLLNGKFDDEAVVFLNGVELERVGLSATADVSSLNLTNYGTAIGGRSVGDGDAQDTAFLDPGSALHAGDNVLAVWLVQVNNTSSDMTMALNVQAATVAPLASGGGGATLHVSRNTTTGAITITWDGTGVLQQTSTIATPASWTDVGAAGANSYTFTPAAGAGQLFFRTR